MTGLHLAAAAIRHRVTRIRRRVILAVYQTGQARDDRVYADFCRWNAQDRPLGRRWVIDGCEYVQTSTGRLHSRRCPCKTSLAGPPFPAGEPTPIRGEPA